MSTSEQRSEFLTYEDGQILLAKIAELSQSLAIAQNQRNDPAAHEIRATDLASKSQILKNKAVIKYDGARCAEKCSQFIFQLENEFDSFQLTDDKIRLVCIVPFLAGTALSWWMALKRDDRLPPTWLAFVDLLTERFFPLEDAEKARSDIKHIRQANFSRLSEMNDAFDVLLSRIASHKQGGMAPYDLLMAYKDALKRNYALYVFSAQPQVQEVHAAMKLALVYDSVVSTLPMERGYSQGPNPADRVPPVLPRAVDNGSPMDLSNLARLPVNALTGVGENGAILKLNDTTRDYCRQHNVCFRCRVIGHNGIACPRFPNNRPIQPCLPCSPLKNPGLPVDFVDIPEIPVLPMAFDNSHNLLRKKICVHGVSANSLFDAGASHNFVAKHFVDKLVVSPVISPSSSSVRFPDGTLGSCFGSVTLSFEIGDYCDAFRFEVIDLHTDLDIVFSKQWFTMKNPSVDWVQNVLKFDHKGLQIEFETNDQIGAQTIHCEYMDFTSFVKATEDDRDAPVFQIVLKALYNRDSPNWIDIAGLEKLILEYADIFQEPNSDLPPERDVEHEINIDPNAKVPAQRLYRLSFAESDELKQQIMKLLERNWIRPSTSPYGAPVLFVQKPNGRGLRLCVDYRALNDITLKDRYGMPRADDCLDQLHGAKIFSKLDLYAGFHQIRIKQEDVHKTAFRTKYGHFEYCVIPFGLTSGPATFQRLMNQVFQPLLDKGVVVYLDDILVYSKTEEEHLRLLSEVFRLLRENKLFAAHEKCELGMLSTIFLGHLVDGDGLHLDSGKVELIKEWPIPKTVSELRGFLGLSNYYRRFIDSYSHISAPLTELTKKDVNFVWSDLVNESFELLKHRLSSAPVLVSPDRTKPFYIFFDASSIVALGSVLCQLGVDNLLHPVAFESRKLIPAELNYAVHEVEMASLVHALKKWRHYLDVERFFVYTDNISLQTFRTNENLSKRQIRWLAEIQQYQFTIKHIPREQNPVADAMSKYPHEMKHLGIVPPEHLVNATFEVVSNPDLIINSVLLTNSIDFVPRLELNVLLNDVIDSKVDVAKDRIEFLSSIRAGYLTDLRCSKILKSPDSPYVVRDSLIWVEDVDANINDRLMIPKIPTLISSILRDEHDFAGHFGFEKTYERIRRKYTWTHMYKDIKRYVACCDSCQRVKASNALPLGLLQPLPISEERWSTITTDFAIGLPVSSRGFDAVQLVVDSHSKSIIMWPCKTTDTSADTLFNMRLFVFAQKGYPCTIISDRDSKFRSSFWQNLMSRLGITHSLATADHQESDGQSERGIRSIKEVLKHYINHDMNNWDELLPDIQIQYNDSVQTSTGLAPFFVDLGRNPNVLKLSEVISDSPSVESLAERIRDTSAMVVDSLQAAKFNQKFYADKYRRNASFKVGDWVLLDASAFNNWPAYENRPSKKLLPRRFGPFKVLHRDKLNYTLQLPETLSKNIYPVFHISKLSPYLSDPDNPKVIIPGEVIDGVLEHHVLAIVAHRIHYNKLQFKVQWTGYSLQECSWEPLANLANCQDLIIEYLSDKPAVAMLFKNSQPLVSKSEGECNE